MVLRNSDPIEFLHVLKFNAGLIVQLLGLADFNRQSYSAPRFNAPSSDHGK